MPVGAARLGLPAALALTLLLGVLLPTATADHPQAAHGDAIVFDHRTGNEWWVEVTLSGGASGSVASVFAQDTNGPWTKLEKKSWGAWAGSFRIEPGHQVRFRADWPGGDQAVSCWFDHPSGVERCSSTPPAPPLSGAWNVREVGAAGNAGRADVALGDIDRDGKPELVMANGAGLTQFKWTGTHWVQRTITTSPADFVVIGDGDNDGDSELYASYGNKLTKHEVVPGGWSMAPLVTVAEPFAAGLVLADVDPTVPGNEIYMAQDDGSSTWIKQVRVGATSSERPIAAVQQQATAAFVAGDGDRDGNVELYWGTGRLHGTTVHQLDHVGHWRQAFVDGVSSPGSTLGIAIGDPDGGGNEVYLMPDHGAMRRAWFAGGQWHAENVLKPDGQPVGFANTHHDGLAFGDGDGDGNGELYFTTGDARVARVEANPWRTQEVAQPHGRGFTRHIEDLLVGDGDGNGVNEVYLAVSHTYPRSSGMTAVFQTSPHALQQPWVVDFMGVRGNEWWVQVRAAGHGEAAKQVDVRLDGGAWQPLAKQDWGPPGDDWAKSMRITQGRIVQFRATSMTGAVDLSDCYRWLPPSGQDASIVACPGGPTPPPPSGGFDAAFSNVRGNANWAEVVVTANQPVRTVFLTIDCGASTAMQHRADWGKWVLSKSIPNGAKVTFTANGDAGGETSGGYTWPGATPTDGCTSGPPPRPYHADFRNPKGNAWWVEVTVLSRDAVTGVDARLDCTGAWRPLTLRDWGAWAASFHVPAGSKVDFRATSSAGATDTSDDAYVWPHATPAGPCAATTWPTAGSNALLRFRVQDDWSDVDGTHTRIANGTITTGFDGTRWDGTCEQRVTTRDGSRWSNRTETYEWDLPPPRAVTTGNTADVQIPEGCALTTFEDMPVVERTQRTFEMRDSQGNPASIDAYHGRDAGPTHTHDAWWDVRHGLLLEWRLETPGSNSRLVEGALLATDASMP